jgi:hypothetical protein
VVGGIEGVGTAVLGDQLQDANLLDVLEYNGVYYTGINALKKIKSLKGE